MMGFIVIFFQHGEGGAVGGDVKMLPHFNESVVWTGRSLEEVGHHVWADSVVLDTQRLEARVLVQGGAEGLYCEVAQLEI